MAVFYITDTGVATGDAGRFSVLQTGAYTNATSYSTVAAAGVATTPPVAGDIIALSNTGVAKADASPFNGVVSGVMFMSVDDSNRDSYLSGARFSGSDMLMNSFAAGILTVRGVIITSGDDWTFSANSQKSFYNDCKFLRSGGGANDAFNLTQTQSHLEFVKCDFDFLSFTDSGFRISNGSSVVFDNITNLTGVTTSKFLHFGGLDTAKIHIKNTALTQFISASGSFVASYPSTDYNLQLTLSRCKLPSGLVFATSLGGSRFTYDVTSCDIGDGYHYFYHETNIGSIEENTTAYLSATYDGTNGFSADMSSSSKSNIGIPLRHKLFTLPVKDLTTTATYTVNFTCADALTDGQFWIEAEFNDDTDHALGVIQSERATNILGGTAHTTNTEAWTGGLANNYEQSITITGVVGANDNGTVSLYVNLAEPNTDVIVCPLVVIT